VSCLTEEMIYDAIEHIKNTKVRRFKEPTYIVSVDVYNKIVSLMERYCVSTLPELIAVLHEESSSRKKG